MKIIIVGGGVAGLSTYLQLQKLLPPLLRDVQILVYDAHSTTPPPVSHAPVVSDSTAIVGNSIILPPSSLRLLHKICPKVYHLFKSRGFENHAFTIRSARGHTLARLATDDGGAPTEYSVSCPRWVLWECLQEVVGEEAVLQGKVVEVDLHAKRPVVRFDDGRTEEAELVIGCDGVHSVVKRSLFGEADKTKYAPQFEGFRGVGTFLDMEEMPETITNHRSVVVTFGPTGSFGYASAAPLSQRRLGWWSNWPISTPPSSSYTDAAEVRAQLYHRHKTWRDPIIQKCISQSSTDRVYPLWTTPDLPHWGQKGCVIMGDAAHTLQATSGQGAAQALEDSVTFTLLLKHHLETCSDGDSPTSHAIDAACRGLYELRHERVANIRTRSRNLYFGRRQARNIFWEYMYYCFLFVVTTFPSIGRWIIGNSFTEAREWDPEIEVQKYVKNSS